MGFSLGLTGGGGAIFAVPLLVYGLGVPAREAVGVSLLTVGSTSLVGFVQRARRGMVEFPTGLLFAVAGMIGAPLGSWLADRIPEARAAEPVRRAHARDRRADVAQGRETRAATACRSSLDDNAGPTCRRDPRRQTPPDIAMRHAARARRLGRRRALRNVRRRRRIHHRAGAGHVQRHGNAASHRHFAVGHHADQRLGHRQPSAGGQGSLAGDRGALFTAGSIAGLFAGSGARPAIGRAGPAKGLCGGDCRRRAVSSFFAPFGTRS